MKISLNVSTIQKRVLKIFHAIFLVIYTLKLPIQKPALFIVSMVSKLAISLRNGVYKNVQILIQNVLAGKFKIINSKPQSNLLKFRWNGIWKIRPSSGYCRLVMDWLIFSTVSIFGTCLSSTNFLLFRKSSLSLIKWSPINRDSNMFIINQ